MTDSPGKQFARLFEAASAFLSSGDSEPDREELLRRHESLRDLLAPMLGVTKDANDADADEDRDGPGRGEPEPPDGAPHGGRFEILEELARGGVGVVYRARDRDLHREVALKTLRENHGRRFDVRRRFAEEARIGGQLQHPGIVPVYELGRGSDARPYFAMKLVRGDTLAALLAARRDLQDRRHHWLSIFEQICQTIAYAHSRGVVHRDLKPGNVMVGAFGEVQVVDWGFAKTLRSEEPSDAREPGEDANAARPDLEDTPAASATPRSGERTSLWGTVIGTPGYMPPEQAAGDVDRMDERSDVFALGAILFEILTGRPPYGEREEAGSDPIEQARACDLTAAFTLLEARCPDRDLADLTRKCLAAAPEQRPRSAAVLADRMRAHLTSVAERARLAEVAASRAELRAEQERRTRRLTLTLAACVAVILGGFLWVREERATRRAQMARSIGANLETVQRLLGEATAGDPADRAAWQLVLARSADLEGQLATADVEPHLQDSVRQLARSVARDAAAANGRAAQRELDQSMVAELEEIAMPEEALHGDGFRRQEAQRAVGAYRAAFTRYGIDVGAPDAASRVGVSAIATELVLGLDHWAEQQRSLDARTEQEALLRLAMAADTDPWRNQLRLTVIEPGPGARERALALCNQLDPGTVAPATLLTALPTMVQAGGRERAIALLRAAHLRHPDHYLLVMRLCLELTSPKIAGGKVEAVRYATAAMALRPQSRGPRHMLGAIEHQLGRLDQAIAVFGDALRREPDCGHWWWHIGLIHASKGDEAAAAEAYQRDLQTASPTAASALNLAILLHKQGRTAEAVAAARTAVSLDRGLADAHWTLALALDQLGEKDDALEALREAARLSPRVAATLSHWLRTRGETAEAVTAARVAVQHVPGSSDAWMALAYALEQQGGSTEKMLHAYREMARLAPEDAHRQSFVGSKLHEHGDYVGAERHHRATLALEPSSANHHRLAVTLEMQKRDADAAAEYEKAARLDERFADAWHRLGIVRSRLRDFAGAIAAMERARDLAPDDRTRREREGYLRNFRVQQLDALMKELLQRTQRSRK